MTPTSARDEHGQTTSKLVGILIDEIMPAWARANEGSDGGLIDPVGAIPERGVKPVATLRLQAQRIDATAEGALAGFSPAGAPRAAQLLSRALQQFMAADGEAGFPRRVDAEGAVIDPVRDLETHAWLLRAIARVHAVTRSEDSLLVADLILDYLDQHLAHRVGGYRPDAHGGRLCAQRPHLRLLEALLALHRSAARPRDRERAHQIVEMFRFHFLDRAAGAVCERFDEDWRPVHAGAAVFRPRTSAQWIVALGAYRAAGGDASVAAEIAVLRRGLLSAVGPDGWLPETVDADGRRTSDGVELATQLAFLSASMSLDVVSEAGRRHARELDARIAAAFFERAVKGCWIEALDGAGFSRGLAPKLSTLCALVEAGALRAAASEETDARLVAFPPPDRKSAYAA